MTPPSQVPQPAPGAKKGMSTGAKIGIGCGAVVALIVIGIIIFFVAFGGKLKKFAEDAQKNPTRATAELMVSASGMEMVAEDDANKRYTVKDKDGKLTTIYWDESTKTAKVINGDFSAIPATPVLPETGSEVVPD